MSNPDHNIECLPTWMPDGNWSGGIPWLPILDIASSLFDHDYGSVTVEDYGKKYTFCTGGWSENEAVICALMDNFAARSMLWESSHRGGKFVFSVRK